MGIVVEYEWCEGARVICVCMCVCTNIGVSGRRYVCVCACAAYNSRGVTTVLLVKEIGEERLLSVIESMLWESYWLSVVFMSWKCPVCDLCANLGVSAPPLYEVEAKIHISHCIIAAMPGIK